MWAQVPLVGITHQSLVVCFDNSCSLGLFSLKGLFSHIPHPPTQHLHPCAALIELAFLNPKSTIHNIQHTHVALLSEELCYSSVRWSKYTAKGDLIGSCQNIPQDKIQLTFVETILSSREIQHKKQFVVFRSLHNQRSSN